MFAFAVLFSYNGCVNEDLGKGASGMEETNAFSETVIQQLQQALLAWYRAYHRDLPWRREVSAYRTWVSEIMLQQTRVEAVIPYFERFLHVLPTLADLAVADDALLHKLWEGLGYYRRARFVQAAATAIVERHGGNIPDDEKALAALPGLGPYTVAAILAIAFNKDVLCVDANVERVFSRLLDLDEPPRRKNAARVIYEQAMQMLPRGKARLYNQALMELGALICGKTPRCPECPVRYFCESCRLGIQRERPVPMAKIPTIDVLGAYGVLMKEQHVFLIKRPEQGLWGGLWELPGMISAAGESPESAVRRVFREKFAVDVDIAGSLGTVRHNYTNHKLVAAFFQVHCSAEAWEHLLTHGEGMALPSADIRNVAMPAHHRKLAARYFEKTGETSRQLSLLGSC